MEQHMFNTYGKVRSGFLICSFPSVGGREAS